jgi:hypothetical protein
MEIAFSWEIEFAGKISVANPSHQVSANCLEFALALHSVAHSLRQCALTPKAICNKSKYRQERQSYCQLQEYTSNRMAYEIKSHTNHREHKTHVKQEEPDKFDATTVLGQQ